MTHFNGKNVLITGAVSGIGRLMARKIAAQGAHIILWDINRDGLDEFSEKLKSQGRNAWAYQCDLSDRASIYANAERVLEDCGPVDVLINNAGIVSGRPILESSDEAIIRTFAVNTFALFWTTRAFLPPMMARNSGHIVNVVSAGGIVGTPRLTDYCSSKFAAFGFDESLRLELRHQGYNIHTTVVCPFYINTGMFRGVKTRFPWLLPILEPEYVADRIVNAIRKNRQRLIMPPFVLAVFLTRLLPPRNFDALVRFFGVSKSMDEFTGRGGSRKREELLKI